MRSWGRQDLPRDRWQERQRLPGQEQWPAAVRGACFRFLEGTVCCGQRKTVCLLLACTHAQWPALIRAFSPCLQNCEADSTFTCASGYACEKLEEGDHRCVCTTAACQAVLGMGAKCEFTAANRPYGECKR